MMASVMAQERTLGDWLEVCEGSGWKLVEVIPTGTGAPSHVVLAPSA
jgi:hypothetical protein